MFKEKAVVIGLECSEPREKVGETRLERLEVREERLKGSRCYFG